MQIRPVRPDEYEAAGELVVQAYRQLPDDIGNYEPYLRDVEGRVPHSTVLVAVDGDDRLLGCVTYVPSPGPLAESDDPAEAHIRMLGVSPDAQGRGVGRRLVEACLDAARTSGRRRVRLLSRPTMAAAHHIYESIGFRRAEDRDRVTPDGTQLLGYVLELAR